MTETRRPALNLPVSFAAVVGLLLASACSPVGPAHPRAGETPNGGTTPAPVAVSAGQSPSSPIPVPTMPWRSPEIPRADASDGLAQREDLLRALAATLPPEDHAVRVDPEALEAIEEEMAALRDEVAALREEVRSQGKEMLDGIKLENERLRAELLRMTATTPPSMEGSPRIPAPGDPRPAESLEPAPIPTAPPPELVQPPVRKRPFVFTSVKEWGRTPEEAAKRGPDVTSLKGMVGVVPSDSAADDLKELGLKLRRDYKDYDNINIEVFNDKDAARAYAETQAMDKAHRVLSVSKHAPSGRDAVLLYEGEREVNIAP